MTTKQEINDFLATIKTCDDIHIVKTEKNRITRYLLGITVQDQENIIRRLTIDDYVSGPESDYDQTYTGLIWKFKKSEYGMTFYIKVKEVEQTIEGSISKALSCHIDHL